MSLSFAQKFARARAATLLLLCLLIVMLTLETWWLAPTSAATSTMLVVMAIKTLPLLLFLRPLQQGRALSGIWLSLLLMPYLCLAILAAMGPGASGRFALINSALIVACCSAAMLLTRWQKQAADAKVQGA